MTDLQSVENSSIVKSMDTSLGRNKINWQSRTVNVSDLKPFERNPRKISAEDFAHLKASIEQDGYHQRVLATNDLRVMGGHQRIKALKELGYETIEILVPDCEISDDQFKRILVRDNLEYGAWELEPLGELLPMGELEEIGFDVSRMPNKKTDGLVDEDATPEPPAAPISAPGDVWLLGEHRVMCGDSTDADSVKKLYAGAEPKLMVTDPPYGVNYDANWRNEAARNCEGMGNRAIGAGAIGKVLNDNRADWREAWALFPGDVAYVWHAGLYSPLVAESLESCGLMVRSQIIWAKSNFAIGRGDYHWKHEPCWYAVRKGGKGHWAGDRKQTTLWAIDKPMKSETGHSTQKPVECMRKPMENNSNPSDLVYDPFLGSGTTVIAAESLGRVCYGMELNPAYVDVIVQRWETFTGKKAVRETAAAQEAA
jgi:DNA modification methylase